MAAGGDEQLLLRQHLGVQEATTGAGGAEGKQQGVQRQTWRPVLAVTLGHCHPSKSLLFSGLQFRHLHRRETMTVLTPWVCERIKCIAVLRSQCFTYFISSHSHSHP